MADVRLFVGGLNVTQHVAANQYSDHVTVALYGLVHGLVHDWWTIFGARDRSLSIMRYRTGYLLPDVRLSFDGAAFEVTAHEHLYDAPELRFFTGPSEVMSRAQAETRLTDLVEFTLTRLRQRGLSGTGAELRWQRIQASRRSNEAAFCEAAGSLELDPYAIDDATAEFIEMAERMFDQPEALTDFVVCGRNVDRHRLLEWTTRMARDRSARYRLPGLRPIVDDVVRVDRAQSSGTAWADGYRRARRIRQRLNLAPSDRFESFKDLALKLGANRSFNLAPKVDGIRALRHDDDGGLSLHLRNHGDTREAQGAHVFALARAVGDAVCFPEPQLGAITNLRSAYRQAAGRAFAAEFLAPSDEIEAMRADKRDDVTIADAFAVSPQVIRHQIENRARILAATEG